MGKDCAWANSIASMWIVFTTPTIIIALDFVYCSLFRKHLMIDHAHYVTILLWVASNSVWAGGELFDPDYDYPFPPDSTDPEARLTPRWYAAWVLIVSFIPVTMAYMLWTYYTCKGTIRDPDSVELVECHSPDDQCPACVYDHTPEKNDWFL